jgi:hypothetical protein
MGVSVPLLSLRSRLLFVVTLLVLGGLFSWGVFSVWHPTTLATQLEIRERGSEKILLTIPIEPGEKFILSYVHSLDGTEVLEEYEVDSLSLIFLGYSGSRAALEYRGYTGPNNRVEFQQLVGGIPLNPEPTGKQTLHVRNQSYALWQLGNRAPIRIRLRQGQLR